MDGQLTLPGLLPIPDIFNRYNARWLVEKGSVYGRTKRSRDARKSFCAYRRSLISETSNVENTPFLTKILEFCA